MEGKRRRLMRPHHFYDFTFLSEALKSEAKDLCTQGQYTEAIEKYTDAIGFNPNDSISYAGRAECYAKENDWKNGLEDAEKSIHLDRTSIPGHHQVIICALRLHRFFEMERSVDMLEKIDPAHPVLGQKSQLMNDLNGHLAKLEEAKANGKHTEAIKHIDECLGICPGLIMYKVQKAECQVGLGWFGDAKALAKEILEQDPNNSEAHYILARCLYETDIAKSVQHFNESFRLNPFCDKDQEFYLNGKRFLETTTTAINAYNQQRFAEAYEICCGMLDEDQTNQGIRGTLLYIMADASYQLGHIDRCLRECTVVLGRTPRHLKALLLRAQCYREQRKYKESVADLDVALLCHSSPESVKMLQEVQEEWAASKNGEINWEVVQNTLANPEGQGGS